MSATVDARGLSCPQPVILTMNEIKKVKKGEIVILGGYGYFQGKRFACCNLAGLDHERH